MPREIVIQPVTAPGTDSGSMEIRVALVDANGDPIPSATATQTVWGVGVHTVSDTEYTLTLAARDELPGDTYYRVEVRGAGRNPYRSRLIEVAAGADPLPWEEFIALGAPVDPLDIWSGRLLPADGDEGQLLAQGADGPEWTAPPAGTGDMTTLIYDPGGVSDDAFDLANMSGNLDGGVFT